MHTTHILISDAQRARYFVRQMPEHTLTELSNFAHPTTTLPQRIHLAHANHTSEDTGKGHGRTGHAGTQFEPHTEVHDKERRSFARHLADFINHEVTEKRCHALVLIATAPMLGDLQPLLSYETLQVLRKKIDKDFTHFSGIELKQRVDTTLS